jgi:hypothetical protein
MLRLLRTMRPSIRVPMQNLLSSLRIRLRSLRTMRLLKCHLPMLRPPMLLAITRRRTVMRTQPSLSRRLLMLLRRLRPGRPRLLRLHNRLPWRLLLLLRRRMRLRRVRLLRVLRVLRLRQRRVLRVLLKLLPVGLVVLLMGRRVLQMVLMVRLVMAQGPTAARVMGPARTPMGMVSVMVKTPKMSLLLHRPGPSVRRTILMG